MIPHIHPNGTKVTFTAGMVYPSEHEGVIVGVRFNPIEYNIQSTQITPIPSTITFWKNTSEFKPDKEYLRNLKLEQLGIL